MKVGILGATGAVGRQMIECLEERNIACDELRLLASSRSAGKTMEFNGQPITIQEATPDAFNGLDVVLGAVEADHSKELAPSIQKAGAVYINNSGSFRMDPNVPLVVPEINGADALNHHGIIANPNCSTIITMMAIAPIHRVSPIKTLITSTYQAVSGAGINGMRELEEEVKALAEGRTPEPKVFPAVIAYNCIPWIGSDTGNGVTTEEAKMGNEGRKILHNPDMKVTCTCVRVPVFRSHSISVSLACEEAVTIDQAKEAIRNAEGVKLVEDGYPMPLDTSNQDIVFAGRIRKDEAINGLDLWCCGDQIRKGAATNAVEILEYLRDHA
ncbi:MAG: aspartate-semialdehyde dehydrogenase [Solobacterium sp.]|nr:aspartate-semialdehyde dehydrogenase [Solobacterium sp.]